MNRLFLTFLVLAITATNASSQDARPAADSTPPVDVSVDALRMRNAARQSFGEGDPATAREHLATLLALYRQNYGNATSRWHSCLAEVAREYLRAGELKPALTLLGEAADLELPLREELDDGFASVAAGLHRRLAALDAVERFELLNAWSMPTENRRTVRVLNSLAPRDAPPKAFARAIGERPRDDSFPVAEINGIDGLFSTAWLLVKSAEETGRLKRLIVELTKLSNEGVPSADDMLLLARIVDNVQRDAQLETATRNHLAVLQRLRAPKLAGKGPVPRHLLWQFGYTEVDADPLRIEFKPLPYWTGSGWEGSAQHADPTLDWTMLDATGGHAGILFSPVRRWVAPADGTLSIVGEFQHLLAQGDGVRARVVSSRIGMSGEWHTLNSSASTIVESLEVRTWDTIDFLVDRVDNHGSDRFLWPLALTLTTSDGEVLKFESTGVDPGPMIANALADATLAAACLGNDRLRSISESIFEQLVANALQGSSPLLRPFLQQAHAVAVVRRHSEVGEAQLRGARSGGFGNTQPLHWVAANGEDAVLHANGGSRALWLAHDEHVLQVTGTRSGALLFRYPLTGEFEFSCEAQQGGSHPTDGGLVYGGLQLLGHSGRQDLTVHDADASHYARKPCPFLRGATSPVFNQLSIRSTAAGWTLAVNGHPVWQDSRLADLSPWIGLRAFGDRLPLFRNMKITGSPIVPREVRLVAGNAMRGWQSKFFGESQPSFVSATPAVEPSPTADWYVNDSTVHNAKRDVEAETEANPQSLLRYQRPLLDGESISYEYFYTPDEIDVYPSLGRLAFLIEPDGVRLHWLTDGANEWTGLGEDNAIVEPLNRRGPKPLALQVDGWNQVKVALAGDDVTLSLNDKVVYEHRLEAADGRQFGLFHDRRHSAVQVRNVVMTGDWPEKLSAEVLSDLAATTSSDRPDDLLTALNDIFGEDDLATNVFAVREHAASMSDEQRYSFLSDWVLPGRGRRLFRLAGAFTTTNPAPVARSSVDPGGQLVAPAYDLVELATRLNRLNELRDRVAGVEPSDEGQQRARFAMLFLVEAARRDQTAAAAACEQLLTLRERRADFSVESLWPEALVAVQGCRSPETQAAVSELCSHLFDRLQGGKRSGLAALDLHLAALLGANSATAADTSIDALPALANWIPASIQTAKTRGAGQPPVGWQRRGHRISKVSPHAIDLLYYRIPLTGDFDVQCNVSPYAMQQGGLMFAGVWQQFRSTTALSEGTLRSKEEMRIAPPLSKVDKSVRMLLRVRAGVCKTFLNGREVSSRQLAAHYEPWLAVYSDGCDLSVISDLRVGGNFVVPRAVELAADERLLGWFSYFDEPVGTAADAAPWRYVADPAGSLIVGSKVEEIAGSFQESLLQYHRPLVEDGVIEYEFYYEPRQTLAHPALDRLAFLLDPDGVKIHWVTDGAYAAAGSDPTNQTVESDHRRGGEVLPLRVNDWNRMAIELRGDTAGLTLNGQLIYERKLEATNSRTFGLFHFADQTEVRVRRIVLRGAWPNAVPPASEQELADKTVSSLDETQARLPAEFSHNFVGGEFPAAYFKPVPTKPGHHFAIRPEGLLAGVETRESWQSLTILPRFTVQGDFDIEVSFDQLQLSGDKTEAIMLNTEHAGDDRPNYRVLRVLDQRNLDRLQASFATLHADSSRRYSAIQTISCESTSGRLRLARRGEAIYYLFAEGDSSAFQVVATQQGTAAETVPDGIQVQVTGNGTSDANVVWKDITIRAEKMTYFPPDDVPPTRKLVVMNADGSEVREITGPPAGHTNLGSPEWSADGQQIAFDVSPGNFADSRIIVVNTDGTGMRDCGLGSMPSFSPDGKRIVFCQPGSGVMMMNADGSNRTDFDASGWGAQWSPDGKWIASGRGENIFVINANSKQERPLLVGDQTTLFDYTYWNLGWSHDSRSVAFKGRNRKTGGDDIVVADLDSPKGFKIMLASAKGVPPDFSFTPDNKRILFAMTNPERKYPQFYTLDRDKDGPPQLLPGQPLDWKILSGAWSPDGKRIAFPGEKIPQPVEWPLVKPSESKK